MSVRILAVGYLPWMAALTIVFYIFPPQADITWLVMGLSSVTAIAVGARRNRPRRATPWLLQAIGVLMYALGDTSYNVLTKLMGFSNPFPSIADAFYLLGCFPLLAAGLLGLVNEIRDRSSLLDALTLTSGLGLLAWIYLIDPYVRDPSLTLFQKSVSIAYPLYDVLLLATVARLVVSANRTPAVRLLVLGGAGLLVSDVLYGLIQLNGEWHTGGPVDFGWVVFYTAWGAAALHPSMVDLTEPRVLRRREVSTRLLALLTLASLIPPMVLLVEEVRGSVRHGMGIAIMSTIMFVLVLSRLSGVVRVHRDALARERGLRAAGASLVSATDAAQVDEAVRRAVAQLLPPECPHRIVLSTDAPTGVSDRGRAVELRYISVLDPDLAARLSGFEIALVCRLAFGDRPSGYPGVGSLCVAADEQMLVGLEGIIEVLAAQAALALQRVALSSEINRRRSEEYFRTLICNATDVILILDDDDRIRYASPSAETMFGSDEVVGQELLASTHPEDHRIVRRYLSLVRGGEASTEGATWRMLRGDTVLEVEASFQDLRADRTVEGLVVTLRDVTDQRRMESELTHRAFYDTLTGLPNRALFTERLQQAVLRAEHDAALVGVLFIDLDDFKVVNDTLGHTTGDDVLIAVGERLMATVRSHDTVARFGGDEFAAIIEGASGLAEIDAVARRVAAVLAEPVALDEHLVSGMASIGVATTSEATTGPDLMRQADLALHVAKAAGKGEWRRYQPALHTALLERMETRTALEAAVANDEFVLHYQPIVELDSGLTVGFEALIRWQSAERGLVPPGQFIEVAEESGLILAIGGWVLANAVSTAAQWAETCPGQRSPYVSVNVSARQFRAPGFIADVRQALDDCGLPPGRLLLEITESLLLRDDEQVWADLDRLRAIGVRVAIDDFGTGYSSLSYLRQMPIDVLKIDRSFTESVGSSRQQRALVDGIVRLAQTLELQVVAEGIEEPDDRHALAAMGCALGQGYLFSRPLGYGDAIQWLKAEAAAV